VEEDGLKECVCFGLLVRSLSMGGSERYFRSCSVSCLLSKELSMAISICLRAGLVALGPDALESFHLLVLLLGRMFCLGDDVLSEGLRASLELRPNSFILLLVFVG
jgi:hypothetical protein